MIKRVHQLVYTKEMFDELPDELLKKKQLEEVECTNCGKKLNYNEKVIKQGLCGKCQKEKMDKIWNGGISYNEWLKGDINDKCNRKFFWM